MEPSPFDPPPAPPLPPEPPPPRPYGAGAGTTSHPGGWAAVGVFAYGMLGVVIGTGVVVASVVTGAGLGAAKLALQNSEADASAADLAIIDRGTEVLVPPMLALGLITLVVCGAVTIAGIGVLRRSERARTTCLLLLAASAVAAIGWCVYSISTYSPAVYAWVREYQEVSARIGIDSGLGRTFDEGAASASSDACTAGVHLLVIAGLAVALRSASARAWCGASAAPNSKQALERSRLPR